MSLARRLHGTGPPRSGLESELLAEFERIVPPIERSPAAFPRVLDLPPLLVIAGTEDRHTTRVQSRRLFARAIAPKELREVPGAGHVDSHRAAGGL